jgi:HD-GYP domain-containing protein (c-di-GMP phosphodiesterase class II)
LTAKDRPYKAAVPIDKALEILESEVKQGKLDGVLFKLFVQSRAYVLNRGDQNSQLRKNRRVA